MAGVAATHEFEALPQLEGVGEAVAARGDLGIQQPEHGQDVDACGKIEQGQS